MASRLEQYKTDESQKRELQSDLTELQTLYNSYEDFYNKYTFDEFLEYATKNSSGSLDKSIENYLIQESDKDKPLKEFRKTTVPWLSETIAGSLSAARFGAENYPSPLLNTLSKLSPNEKEIRRGTDKAFKNVGKAVGLGDIWDEKKDKETGKTYYELQEPETTAGKILKPVGEYVTALAVTRNPTALFTKTAQKVPEKITRKVGRPSKAQLAKKARQEKTKKLLGAGKTLGRAELAAQVTFADNPEFTYVASSLSNYIGNDNNLMGEVLNYLDTTEDSPEEARRLSLLLDGLAFSGIVSAGVGTLKVTKEGILQMLQSVKNSNQSQKESFKSLIQGASKTKSARKKDVSEVPIIKDISNEDVLKFGKDSLTYKTLNKGYRGVQRLHQNFLTTSGMYSDEMFKMLKSADYNKIAWSKRASEIHAKLVTSISKAAKTSKFSEKEIDDILNQYFKGKKTLSNLPKNPELRQFAKEAKDEVNNLSKMLLESNYVPPQMKKVIEENMGSYLRKTYQFYENKNWKPSQEVIDEVTSSIAGSIQKAKGTKNITPFQQQEARRVVNEIIKRDDKSYNNIVSHLNGVFGTKKNEVVFQQRKNIAPAIQKLLGAEEVDASLAVFRTLDTLGTQITNYKLYDDLYEKGLGKWFFKETGKFSKAPDESLKAATIEGKQFLQLDGLRTTPEIAELFNTMARNKGQTRQTLERMYGYFLTAKGSSQAAATVFNGLTHVRNTLGGSIILMRNGINPFTDETIKSSQILSNDLFTMDATKKNKVLSDLYEDYQRLGIVNQNVRVGEFKNLINDLAANPNENMISKFPEIFKKAGRKATSVYVAEDDLWRIVAYNKELNTLKKAYPDLARRNLQDLKQEAADVVRATMPTYDLIAPGLQELRKLPIGNFFSFTAEQFRNNYNTTMRAAQELRSGNKVIQDRGMNRLASQVTTTYLFSKGLTDFSKLAFGISDEDEKAVRSLNLAPWSKNSALLFSKDNKGNIQYIDLTYTDPSAPVTDNFRNILNLITDPTESMETVDRNIIGQTIEGLEFFLRPFVDEALLTEAITDILVRGGKTKEGFDIKIINPVTKEPLVWEERVDNNNLAEVANNMDVALGHILEKVLPREATDIASLTRGKKAIRIEEGKTSLQRELIGKLTGQRLVTISPDKIKNDFSFKLRDLNKARGTYQSNINSSITKNMKAESVLSRYEEENNKNYKEFVKSKRVLDAAKHFDIDPFELETLVKENLTNYTKDEKSTFIYSSNEYIPLKISDKKLNQAYKDLNFENINFREFYDAYTVKYLEYSQLPLLEEEKQKEKELKRKGFFLGGLADEYQYYSQLSEEVEKLPEKAEEFIKEREERRAEAHKQIVKATKEGDVRKGFEAFETLPIGEQLAGYMNPVTNVPLSATGAAVYAEKAQPSFKSTKEFVLDFINPKKNILQKTPIKVEDPMSAGISSMEALGVIPFIGGIGKFGSRTLRKMQSRRADDTMGGGSGPTDIVDDSVAVDMAGYKSSIEETAEKNVSNFKTGEQFLNFLKAKNKDNSPKREGFKKEELEFIDLDNIKVTKDTTPEEVLNYVRENRPKLYRVVRSEDNPTIRTSATEVETSVEDILSIDRPSTSELENDYVNIELDNFKSLRDEGVERYKDLSDEQLEDLAYDMVENYNLEYLTGEIGGVPMTLYGGQRGYQATIGTGDNKIFLTDDLVNRDEALIQLNDYARTEGLLDPVSIIDGNFPLKTQVSESVLKGEDTLPTLFGEQYESFRLPMGGASNYREITIHLDNPRTPTVFTKNHLEGADQLLHYRISDRADIEGNKVLFVEEIQSDLHQAGRAEGYELPLKKQKLIEDKVNSISPRIMFDKGYKDNMLGNKVPDKIEFDKDMPTIAGISSGSNPSALIPRQVVGSGDVIRGKFGNYYETGDVVNFSPLEKTTKFLEDEYGKETILKLADALEPFRNVGKLPDYPYKGLGFVDVAMKDVMQLASKEGYDKVAFTDAATQIDRNNKNLNYVDSIQISKVPTEKEILQSDEFTDKLSKNLNTKYDDFKNFGDPDILKGEGLQGGGEAYEKARKSIDNYKKLRIGLSRNGEFTSISIEDEMKDLTLRQLKNKYHIDRAKWIVKDFGLTEVANTQKDTGKALMYESKDYLKNLTMDKDGIGMGETFNTRTLQTDEELLAELPESIRESVKQDIKTKKNITVDVGKLEGSGKKFLDLYSDKISSTAKKLGKQYKQQPKFSSVLYSKNEKLTPEQMLEMYKDSKEAKNYGEYIEKYGEEVSFPRELKVISLDVTPDMKKPMAVFSKGGLVKGKDDVPFTKEDPADRVDPNTGKPYSDQMARLGLAEGGSVDTSARNLRQLQIVNPKLKPWSEDPFINKIIMVESSGNPNAVSPVGAKGLMQIMKNTAKQPGFGVKPFEGDNLLDPKENVRFGTDYIYALEKKLGSKRDAAVAYNWGYGNAKRWLKEGADLDKLPKETRNYIRKLELD